MRELPLNALRAFAQVYETGGVRPAARALEISHSSVSRHLRELEAWLGLALIETRPGARSLAFTTQGESLGKAALASLRALEGAVAALREARRGNAVILTTTPSLAARWLLPRLPDFEARYPWIEISVIADQRFQDLAVAGIDLALRMGKGPWPDLSCTPLMDDALFPVMAPHAWKGAGRPSTPADLVGLRLLHDRDPNAAWDIWRRDHGVPALDVRPGPRYSSLDLVLRAAAQGLGVALARGRLAADDLAAGLLMRPCGDREVVLPNAYWIVRAPTAPPRAAVGVVVDWLTAQAEIACAAFPEASDGAGAGVLEVDLP